MAAQTVSGDAIVQGFGDLDLRMERLTALQQAGMKILLWVGVVSSLVLLGLVFQWISHSPRVPTLSVNSTDSQQMANAKAALENYKTASDLAWEGPARLFDVVILKVLYPLITLVLGYIFGTRVAGTNRTSE